MEREKSKNYSGNRKTRSGIQVPVLLSLVLLLAVAAVWLVMSRERSRETVSGGTAPVAVTSAEPAEELPEKEDSGESGTDEKLPAPETHREEPLPAGPGPRFADVLLAADLEAYAIREDGTVAVANVTDSMKNELTSWKKIVQLASTDDALFGLHRDGRVSCVLRFPPADGESDSYREVPGWNDITKLVTSDGYHIFGLREDGSVVSAGAEWFGSSPAFDISDWTDIKQLYGVTGMESYLCGLREDGTLLNLNWSFEWSGTPDHLTEVACGKYVWLGLEDDGTVILSGIDAPLISEEVSQWRDVVQVAAGASKAAGLLKDGTVVTAGFVLENPQDWTDVAVIQMDDTENLFGIREDGRVLHCCADGEGPNPVNTEMLSTWTDVRKLVTGWGGQVLALRGDGSLVGVSAEELSK